MKELFVGEFKPRSMLRLPEHVPERARFPVIDAHNHLFGDVPAAEMIGVMDQVGVAVFVNVTGNTRLPFDNKGYTIEPRDFRVYADGYLRPHPTRFAALTMADFARWDDFTLFRTKENPDGNPQRWVERCIAHFEEDVALGARGLKITKELGLRFRDNDGSMLRIDDRRLFPVWKRAGELGLPVLIHTSDPAAFFLPLDETNEHAPTLLEFVSWGYPDAPYGRQELLEQRNRVIAAHPGTQFICAHMANNTEDLAAVSRFLERHPNAVVDLSARIDELGRQPYTAREFMIRYQDRVLFGTDMPVRPDIYRAYFRFLETRDEYFEYPDYIGRWGHCRWRIYGLGLPDGVLEKIYHRNALRVIPGLEL
jgi:predicted TIM-barrel fold metal-dependent hydrolase